MLMVCCSPVISFAFCNSNNISEAKGWIGNGNALILDPTYHFAPCAAVFSLAIYNVLESILQRVSEKLIHLCNPSRDTEIDCSIANLNNKTTKDIRINLRTCE
jgi:hypothetical protein